MLLQLLAIMTVSSADPGAAAIAPAAAPAVETGLKPGQRKIKVVCRTVASSGTRFVKRQCVEASADARQQEIDRRAFEEVQNRPVVNISRGN